MDASAGAAAPSASGRETLVDSRGRRCPLPVIDLAKAMAAVEVGDEVLLLSDDEGSRTDVPAWCRMRRQELVAVEPAQDHTRYRIRRRV
ncbi:sulfurtransferase TusA family protein [Euzebya tangerina]|uniref:sulfurtransferase TusA family protein n=1 Tax=Euzebya tangerina TaxID=591198 RepID=UPI00196B3A01|nr:sulfurtransferase TusA family protein [Euzebya tangerina]